MKERGTLDKMRGGQGYDNALVSMRALFIAHGAAFKKGYTAEPFENVEIYNLMCDILGLKLAKNDGNFNVMRGLLRNPKLQTPPRVIVPH